MAFMQPREASIAFIFWGKIVGIKLFTNSMGNKQVEEKKRYTIVKDYSSCNNADNVWKILLILIMAT